jgi:hypothetical protein
VSASASEKRKAGDNLSVVPAKVAHADQKCTSTTPKSFVIGLTGSSAEFEKFIDDPTVLLKEIREYKSCGMVLVFHVDVVDRNNVNSVIGRTNKFMRVDLLKTNCYPLVVPLGWATEPFAGEQFNTVLRLVTEDVHSIRGALNQRKGAIKIFLKYFLHLAVDIIANPPVDGAFEFALDCLWLNQKTGKNICSDYIERYMKPEMEAMDEATNLSAEQIEWLEANVPKSRNKGKNKALIDYLSEPLSVRDVMHEHHVVHYCERCMVDIQRKVDTMLAPAAVQLAQSKTAARIQQKYEEYCHLFLSPGVHAYKKFKDLFRGSISFEDFQTLELSKLVIADFQVRSVGNYRAGYVVLNVDSMNVELKIVKSTDEDKMSHLWYELRRNSDPTNISLFVVNHLRDQH